MSSDADLVRPSTVLDDISFANGSDSAPPLARVTADGKQFAVDGERFLFRGVTYGTFAARSDGALFPETAVIAEDLAAIASSGFTVIRTYTEPPADLLHLAAQHGLRVLAGIFYPDWRYLLGRSGRDRRRVLREAAVEVRTATERLAGNPTVLAVCLGNEIPADVVRWYGEDVVAAAIRELSTIVREVDPGMLVTYGNYPSAEYLSLPDLDFLTFNVFLERAADFRKYLTRLQNFAGDRPVVLGEVGLDAGDDIKGEVRQAWSLHWQMETIIERGIAGVCVFSWTDEWCVGGQPVEGWRFGLTDRARHPRASLDVARLWNTKTVSDLDFERPSISVVVCAYNAEATIEECLVHTSLLDYPKLEIIVVDDGSTDATAELARQFPKVRLIQIEHAGLSVARNIGMQEATGELVAYLDSDAYPTPEWPYYLALGMDSAKTAGVGGPNLPPAGESRGALQVAQAPGGPVHVLTSDDRAEHVPGCNMAFWRDVLLEVGGCDPIYTSAGDDVDLCWRVLDRGWEIGFHPAAVVWHHRRGGLRPYLRQQRGYGRSEALVEARHPNRFTAVGTARWHGRIYSAGPQRVAAQRIYRGIYGAAAYQSVYGGGGHVLDLAHQVGVPLGLSVLLSAPLALLLPSLGLPALIAALYGLALFCTDMVRTPVPRQVRRGRLAFRAGVALMHLAQPVVRTWGRARHRDVARRELPSAAPVTGPLIRLGRGVVLLPLDRPRAVVVEAITSHLRRTGLRLQAVTGWERYDVRLIGSSLVVGDLQTSAHPEGSVQLVVRRRLRYVPATCLAALGLTALVVAPLVAALIAGVAAGELVRGAWRTGTKVRMALDKATATAEVVL